MTSIEAAAEFQAKVVNTLIDMAAKAQTTVERFQHPSHREHQHNAAVTKHALEIAADVVRALTLPTEAAEPGEAELLNDALTSLCEHIEGEAHRWFGNELPGTPRELVTLIVDDVLKLNTRDADLIKAVPRTAAERASTPTKTFEQFSHEHGRRTNSEMNTDLILMKEALGIARAAIQTTLSSRGRPRPEEFLNSDSFATALLSWVACKDALTAIANALQEPQS